MKVVAINGSAKTDGNTAHALSIVTGALNRRGIETERIDIGTEALHGCIGCGVCRQKQNRRCVFDDDGANAWMQKMFDADGIVLGTPVYYAGVNGALKSFLDRAFFVGAHNGGLFRHKVGAAVAAVRRAGSLPALDQIQRYFGISEMFVPAGNYWNMAFGMTPGEAARDLEAAQCLEILGENMAWLLAIIERGRSATPPPPRRDKVAMNFIRD